MAPVAQKRAEPEQQATSAGPSSKAPFWQTWQHRQRLEPAWSRAAPCSICALPAPDPHDEKEAAHASDPDDDLSSWMTSIPDDTSVASLWMPGTHQSASFFGFISACQKHSLSSQLHLGVRFLDLRFAVKKGQLRAYHGIQSQRLTAAALFAQLYAFIRQHHTETVIVSVKREDGGEGFDALMRRTLDEQPDLWYLENRFPSLGEVRGKLILLSRFGHGPRLGLHPVRWPFNAPADFDYTIAGVQVWTQDWCGLVSPLRIPEKVRRVVQLGLLRPPAEPGACCFKINFSSATAVCGGVPSLIANGFGWPALGLGLRGVNFRLLEWLRTLRGQDRAEELVGCGGQCFMMDFVDQDLASVIISFNQSFTQKQQQQQETQ